MTVGHRIGHAARVTTRGIQSYAAYIPYRRLERKLAGVLDEVVSFDEDYDGGVLADPQLRSVHLAAGELGDMALVEPDGLAQYFSGKRLARVQDALAARDVAQRSARLLP